MTSLHSLEGPPLSKRVKSSEYAAEDHVSEHNGNWRANPVMQGQETGRFELSNHRRAVLLISHTRVHAGQEWHANDKHKRRVNNADESTEPPSRCSPGMKRRDVKEREEPAIDEMDQYAD